MNESRVPIALLDKLGDTAAEHEELRTFPRSSYQELILLGILADVGTAGWHARFASDLVALAQRWVGLAEVVHIQAMAYRVLQQRYAEASDVLGKMAAGEAIAACCLSEKEAGSDLAAIATTARHDGDTYVLNGTKTWTGLSPHADVLIVFARTGTRPGIGGLSAFCVPRHTAGVEVGADLPKMGVRSLPTANVHLRDVTVGRSCLIGREGRVVAPLTDLMRQGRFGISAIAIGLTRACVARAVAYGRRREQFGQAIIVNQGVSFPLARLRARLSACTALLRQIAETMDAGGLVTDADLSSLKVLSTDLAMDAAQTCVQTLGAVGYASGDCAERWMREAKLLQIIEGTNEIQLRGIAATMLSERTD